MGLTATLWFIFGFGLAFGESVGGVVGSAASFPLLLNMDPCTPAGYPMATGLHLPAFLFAVYQMMFGAHAQVRRVREAVFYSFSSRFASVAFAATRDYAACA